GVALLRDKEERFPGQFTTAANLGWLLAMQDRYGAAAEALERAAQLGSDEQRSQAGYLLLLVRWRDRLGRDRAGAANACMLGFDVAEKLGQEFRTAAAPETEVAPLLAQLGLRSDVYEALVGLIVLDPEQAEPYFALAELLAARADRKLAWHAYQRAYDLEHPRSVDILLFQDQVRAGLSRDGQAELTSLAHVRLRRRALEWQKAWQTFERQLIAAGGDPAEPAALARFRAEHPVP
ncbi:MAG: hypothetical protein HXY24_13525, partial [Rubrivivax sp.]|nr:hypothetical protein [Rubrivivax sp.]